jgi:glutamate racemase
MLKNKKKFIGVFDFGFGGINILREIVKELPVYNYLYLGDTTRAPYGTRSKEVVYEFTKQAVDFRFANNCEFIIFACNTASSDALRKIQQEYLPKYYPDKKVLGALIPAAEEAITKTKNKKIGVIATEGTVHSGALKRELTKINPKIKVFQNPCLLFVPIVEAGEQNSIATKIILENYLKPLKNKGIDTLILECTHYGILENQIKKIVGFNVVVISEAKVIPKKLKNYLKRHPEIERRLGKNKSRAFPVERITKICSFAPRQNLAWGSSPAASPQGIRRKVRDRMVNFYSTDITNKFTSLGSKFFGRKIKVKKVF